MGDARPSPELPNRLPMFGSFRASLSPLPTLLYYRNPPFNLGEPPPPTPLNSLREARGSPTTIDLVSFITPVAWNSFMSFCADVVSALKQKTARAAGRKEFNSPELLLLINQLAKLNSSNSRESSKTLVIQPQTFDPTPRNFCQELDGVSLTPGQLSSNFCSTPAEVPATLVKKELARAGW